MRVASLRRETPGVDDDKVYIARLDLSRRFEPLPLMLAKNSRVHPQDAETLLNIVSRSLPTPDYDPPPLLSH